jgi:hypothetical protein
VLVIVGYFLKRSKGKVTVFEKSGLVEDCFMVSITTSLLPFFLAYFVDVEEIMRSITRCRVESQIESKECMLTQGELNKALEHSHFYVSEEYATACVIVLYNAFFSAMQPIVALFGFVGLGLLYLVKKHLILTRYSRPDVFGKSINEMMNSVVDFCPLLFAFGAFMCMNLFKNYTSLLIPNAIGLGLACVNIFFPLEYIFNLILGDGANIAQRETYPEIRMRLYEEYDRSNPVTKDKAIQEYL